MRTIVNRALVAQQLNPFYQAQQIIARLLYLKPQQLSELEPQQQVDLLCQLVSEPKREVMGMEYVTRLIAAWSPAMGYKPWHQQPGTMLSVQQAPTQDWAHYLSDFARLLGTDARHTWALFELHTVPSDWMQGSRRIQYVLVPLLDCVHQHAESIVFTHQAA